MAFFVVAVEIFKWHNREGMGKKKRAIFVYNIDISMTGKGCVFMLAVGFFMNKTIFMIL